MFPRSLVAVLAISLPAWAEAPRVKLAKGFAPNPQLLSVKRAEGGAAPLDRLVCKNAAPGALISKEPAAVLELEAGTRLTLATSSGDGVVARSADGVLSCSDKALTVDAKAGALEVYVVTAGQVPADAEAKLRVMDSDRPRILPDAVKTVSLEAKSPIMLQGQLAPPPGAVPDVQLEVPTALAGVQWKLFGAAGEVWLSPLTAEFQPATKAPAELAAGRYAVWVRGATGDAVGNYTVVGLPNGIELDPLKSFSTPEADDPVEARALTAHLPGLDPQAMKGASKNAVALRRRAFTELPAEFFVFAAADSEVLLVLEAPAGEVSVIAADGATFSMTVSELKTEPSGGGPLVRPLRSELLAKLKVEDLANEKDPRVKALLKLRKATLACLEKHAAKPDVSSRRT
jgi:hypothetical protein